VNLETQLLTSGSYCTLQGRWHFNINIDLSFIRFKQTYSEKRRSRQYNFTNKSIASKLKSLRHRAGQNRDKIEVGKCPLIVSFSYLLYVAFLQIYLHCPRFLFLHNSEYSDWPPSTFLHHSLVFNCILKVWFNEKQEFLYILLHLELDLAEIFSAISRNWSTLWLQLEIIFLTQ
jgi:hypothetical protein